MSMPAQNQVPQAVQADARLHADNYPEIVRAALREMHHQVGDLIIDETGVAKRGVLVRHLVLPEDVAGTRAIMRFIAQEISTRTYVNIMSQYRPCGDLSHSKSLQRSVSIQEYRDAISAAKAEGIRRLDKH